MGTQIMSTIKRKATSVAYNELAVAKIVKTERSKQAEYQIDGLQGFSIVVKPSGVATFYVRYQTGTGVNRNRVCKAVGQYGDGKLSLADAKTLAMALLTAVAKGADPVAEENAATIAAQALTLKQLFAERVAKDKDTQASTLAGYRRRLEKDVFPKLGDKIAGELTAKDFAKVLEGIAARSEHAAHQIRSGIGSTYRWAMKQWRDGERLVIENPVATIGFNHQSDPRKRILTDDELSKLWRTLETFSGIDASSRRVIQLAILTGQRNSEVAGMERKELTRLDTATPRWDIPAHRMKRKSADQHVPLSTQAAAIVQEALADTKDRVHLFPGSPVGIVATKTARPDHIAQTSISHAFAKLRKAAKISDVNLHDMRKCVVTWLAEHGHATGDVLDAILHHGKEGVTGSHYNFALYEGQVRKALQVWADHVDAIAAGKVMNVVNLPKRTA
jgi:integrase